VNATSWIFLATILLGILTGALCCAEGSESAFREFLDSSYRRHTGFEESLEELRAFDRDDLLVEDQLSYDLYAWYLEDQIFFRPIALGDVSERDVLYADLLRHYTTRSSTPEEWFEVLLAEVERHRQAVDVLYDRLGIGGESMAERRAEALAMSEWKARGTGQSVTVEMQAYVDGAQRALREHFTYYPTESAVVTQVAGLSALAGFRWGSEAQGRPNQVQILPGRDGVPYYLRRTVSYHEAFPGHYVQELTQKLLTQLPEFRLKWGLTAYNEGWALYGEQLAWDVGLYEGVDPLQELGFVESQLFRSAFAMADIALRAIGWTQREVEMFLIDTLGIGVTETCERVARIVESPGAAAASYAGFHSFVTYRERARASLGDRFRLIEYHDLVLQTGPVPMDFLEKIVDAYIAGYGT